MESIFLTRNERIWMEKEKKISARKRKIQRYAVVGTTAAGIMLSVYSDKALACACNDIYTVQKGDTLYELAKKYNVTVEQMQNANGLSSDMIYAGQRLEVPFLAKNQPEQVQQPKAAPAQTGASQTNTYIVQPGDSLSLLANKYGTSIEQIKKDNGLSSDLIRVGQALAISGAKAPAPVKEAPKTGSSKSATHIVQPGDSLSLLANKYGSSVEQIKKDNGLSSDLIRVGQPLAISGPKSPAPVKETAKTGTDSASASVYTVAAGDTLWEIAQRFHLSPSDIKLYNEMTSDMVYIGQKLVIKANSLVKTTATVVGAADNFTVEFETEKGVLVLQVAYGTGQNYSNLSGKKVELVYSNGKRPALVSYQLIK